MAQTRWTPADSAEPTAWPRPEMGIAIRRGLGGHCPACGKSHLFNGFLKVVPECRSCHAPLGLARADDAPPYLTILITAHIVVPLMYAIDRAYDLSTASLSAIFLPLTAALTIGMLRPIKGATIGVMVRLNMLKDDAAHI